MVKENMVFIIDDDLIINEIHSLLINKLYPDILVKTFTSSIEAIQAIDDQELPGTIFLDLHMPGETETFFLDEYKSRYLTSDIYLMSSLPYLENTQLLSSYPAIVDFISKPLLKHKLRSAFNHYV
jgi:response regulator of citrate/malate metabolism